MDKRKEKDRDWIAEFEAARGKDGDTRFAEEFLKQFAEDYRNRLKEQDHPVVTDENDADA